MSRRDIRIDRMTVRLRGVSPDVARDLGGAIGRDLIRELSRQTPVAGRRPSGRVDAIDSGRATVAAGSTAADLRGTIVNRIARAVQRAGR